MDEDHASAPTLRRGWTTGACAAAAAKAAATALATGAFPDPVEIALPRGGTAAFALAGHALEGGGIAWAAIVKDAGDDPDVTHGALIRATVRRLPPGAGVRLRAGEGVGTVTRAGLPIPPGEPAINPVPREMIRAGLAAAGLADAEVTIAIPGGEALAARTLNGRLGIVGGLSVLGTTGIVVPYSCAAWIATIRHGIDVARAAGLEHVAASTGATSERAVAARYGLPDMALIEMGDFVGGTLKHLARAPVPRVTIAGGLAKMAKLAQGRLDLHSKRGSLDLEALETLAGPGAAGLFAGAASGAEAFARAEARGLPLGDRVAAAALAVARPLVEGRGVALEVLLFDREGRLRGEASDHARNRRG